MSTPINDGGPAFPVPDSHCPNGQVQYGSYGMSLRDYFAGQALLGELASTSGVESTQAMAKACVDAGRTVEGHLAFNAYLIADAMLAARNQKGAA